MSASVQCENSRTILKGTIICMCKSSYSYHSLVSTSVGTRYCYLKNIL